MENLFLFALRASFIFPILAGFAFFLTKKGHPYIISAVLGHSIVFGMINTFHNSLIISLGIRPYWFTYTALEFLSLSIIIFLSNNSKAFRIATVTICLSFLANLVIQAFAITEQKPDSTNIGIETILVTINIIYYFYLRFKRVDDQYLYQSPYFWFMTGILIYLGFTFFFNILVNHVEREVIRDYYHFSYIGDIVKNLLFAVGLLQLPRRSGTADRTQTFNAPNLDLI